MERTSAYNNERSAYNNERYEMSGRIMLSALVFLFFVVVIVFALHLYARWFLIRARRRHLLARRGRTRLVFYVESDYNPATTVSRGLEPRVLRSLPLFAYSAETHPDSVLECAVCLSEFQENESGRNLPKCNHNFHTECIDMWFYSHSTCPLCRTPVEEYKPTPGDVALAIHEPAGVESGMVLGSGLSATCEQIGSPSFGGRKKLSLEVPRRSDEGFEGESSSYRSPMSRMLSFKRILSRERRQSPCASPRTVAVIESDTRRGVNQV